MTTREGKYRLPAQVINRGQFSVSVAAPERKQILLKLLRKARTDKVGTAAWKAILAYVGEDEDDKDKDETPGGRK